ncbi:transcriptional regulator [Pseudomonas fragi]|uniref:Transcriptional regulator n=1 Tax=Pseudomonas fragi TaxID=296 RepID=A0A266LQF2_PSEFR|nr:helix-turn-helix transcriptional regulator [Pseudomonas fragi]OZY39662.1 transcriptional regulator [Pseudomonas fragi]
MKDNICQYFGRRIRVLRLNASLSQEQLASICDLDRTYIGGIERGERNPTLKNIFRLSKALNVPMSILFDQLESTDE